MPFLSIYSLALEQDMDYGAAVLQTAVTLQNHTFLQVRETPAPTRLMGHLGANGWRDPLHLLSLFALQRTPGGPEFLTWKQEVPSPTGNST